MRRHIDAPDAGQAQLLDHVGQDGTVADRQHRLGRVVGQRLQAGAEAAGHHHRGDRQVILIDQVRAQQQTDDAACLVHDRQVRDAVAQVQQAERLRRRQPGLPHHRFARRNGETRIAQGLPPQNRPADVAVGDDAGQAAVGIGQQDDAQPAAIQRFERDVHRRVRRQRYTRRARGYFLTEQEQDSSERGPAFAGLTIIGAAPKRVSSIGAGTRPHAPAPRRWPRSGVRG